MQVKNGDNAHREKRHNDPAHGSLVLVRVALRLADRLRQGAAMKPAAFDFIRPRSIEGIVEALAEAGSEGKIIAGGQSLMPMINFRLVKPSVLIDVNAAPGLDRIEKRGDRIHIGATVRHCMTASDAIIGEHLPIVAEAMRHVAHFTVRNRGTFGGSVCHADPAAEMPMMTRLLNGRITARSHSGERVIEAEDFFVGSLMTALEPDEFVTSIAIDALPPGAGWGFEEFSRRPGDFAMACVATTLEFDGGGAKNVRFAMMGIADAPQRFQVVEQLVEGQEIDASLLNRVAAYLSDILAPNTDIHASADYRRHLSGGLARRALTAAWRRAREAAGAPG
jgi:carbon-monoxide dehydrogenase medium subunit